jgi:hypothetical protein
LAEWGTVRVREVARTGLGVAPDRAKGGPAAVALAAPHRSAPAF